MHLVEASTTWSKALRICGSRGQATHTLQLQRAAFANQASRFVARRMQPGCLCWGVKAPFGKVEALQLHGHLKMASLHLVLANFQAKVLV